MYYLSEYKSNEPQRGFAVLPKRAVNVNENEIVRLYKIMNTCIEPISFKVPRKNELFQPDLYPDTVGPNPALQADEFFAGQTSTPNTISLAQGYVAPVRREFSSSFEVLSTPQAISLDR